MMPFIFVNFNNTTPGLQPVNWCEITAMTLRNKIMLHGFNEFYLYSKKVLKNVSTLYSNLSIYCNIEQNRAAHDPRYTRLLFCMNFIFSFMFSKSVSCEGMIHMFP